MGSSRASKNARLNNRSRTSAKVNGATLGQSIENESLRSVAMSSQRFTIGGAETTRVEQQTRPGSKPGPQSLVLKRQASSGQSQRTAGKMIMASNVAKMHESAGNFSTASRELPSGEKRRRQSEAAKRASVRSSANNPFDQLPPH